MCGWIFEVQIVNRMYQSATVWKNKHTDIKLFQTIPKESPRGVRKDVFNIVAKLTGKRCTKASFLMKKVTLGRCFPVNFAKFLRTAFFTEHYGALLLTISPIKLENN